MFLALGNTELMHVETNPKIVGVFSSESLKEDTIYKMDTPGQGRPQRTRKGQPSDPVSNPHRRMFRTQMFTCSKKDTEGEEPQSG